MVQKAWKGTSKGYLGAFTLFQLRGKAEEVRVDRGKGQRQQNLGCQTLALSSQWTILPAPTVTSGAALGICWASHSSPLATLELIPPNLQVPDRKAPRSKGRKSLPLP